MQVEHRGNSYRFQLQAYLNDLPAELVRVELYADPLEDEGPVRIPMACGEALIGAISSYLYTTNVPDTRPSSHYTARIVPHHPLACVPLEVNHIFWAD